MALKFFSLIRERTDYSRKFCLRREKEIPQCMYKGNDEGKAVKLENGIAAISDVESIKYRVVPEMPLAF